MKHKFIIITITSSLITAGLLATIILSGNLVSAANLDQALSTLPQNEEWSIMAYAAMGQNVGQPFLATPLNSNIATDYEKRILAITAQGKDPRTLGSENFVAKLESMFDGTQIGDLSLLNDDIFGLLALSSAGEQGNIINQERSLILSKQNSDGGWGFATNIGSDSNTTAMAVAALKTTGSTPGSAINYLMRSQDSSGGFGFTPSTAADGASTAWVMWGLTAAGASIPSNATSFLQSLQLPDGSFKWRPTDTAGSALITAYTIIALSNHTLPINSINNPPPVPPPPPPPPPPNPPPPSPSPTPTPIPTPTPAPNPGDDIITHCRVSVFHTDFAFPPEGGKIVRAGSQLFFIKTYVAGCENAGSNYPVVKGPTPPPSSSPLPTPLPPPAAPNGSREIPVHCRIPVYHTNFAFPAEGGLVVQALGQLYFIKTYQSGCENAANGYPVVKGLNPTPAPPPPLPSPIPPPTPTLVPPPPSSCCVYKLSINYPGRTVFLGNITYSSANPSVLQVLTTASNQNNLQLKVRTTSLGVYVYSIGGYPASGSAGWQYAVNGITPAVGAADYNIKNNDLIKWFYGPPGTAPY